MQKMSQEFVQQGLNNAGSMARTNAEISARSWEAQTNRNDERRQAYDEKQKLRKQQLGYLGELLAEQEALVDAAADSGDEEQIRRIPEVQANIERIRKMLSAPTDFNTLEGVLKRNVDRQSLEAETAGNRGALRKPQEGSSDTPTQKPEEKGKKKDDGTRLKPSARAPISLDS